MSVSKAQMAIYAEATVRAAAGEWLRFDEAVDASVGSGLCSGTVWRDAPIWMFWRWGKQQMRPRYRADALRMAGRLIATAAEPAHPQ